MSSASGRLMSSVFGAVAAVERALLLDRPKAGIAKAKADEVRRLKGAGVSPTEIAGRLGIGRASVHQVLQGGEGSAGNFPHGRKAICFYREGASK